MNINYELYKIFYVVAKNKHMSKAAEELYISQPAISQAIKKLEGELGGTLFLRSNKGMELTEEGKMFFEYVKGAVELINSAENEFSNFKDLNYGEIKIGISTTLTKLVLMDALEKFHADFPNIRINITNELTSNLLYDLNKGKLDFVIFNESNVHETNVKVSLIREINHSFIYNKEYFKFDKKIKLEELSNYPLIFQKSESNSRKFLNDFLNKKNISLIPSLEVVSADLVVEFTNIGLGIGFVINELIDQKTFKNIKMLKINTAIPTTKVLLATNKSIALTFAAKKFTDYIFKYNNIQ